MTPQRHVFHEQLARLSDRLTEMGALVGARAHQAVSALLERRIETAQAVITGDDEIDNLELAIDDQTLHLLALQQPEASDLRYVRSAIKITTDLERIGDQAVNIAETAVRLIPLAPLAPVADVARLSEVANGMLRDVMHALRDYDTDGAFAVLERDDEADELRDTIFRELLTFMQTDPSAVERALGLMLIARALERIADHATNIAEDVVFLVEGRVVTHQRPGHHDRIGSSGR